MKRVSVFNTNLPVIVKGSGEIPLLIVGPATLFTQSEMLPETMNELFTLYFVDIFSDAISMEQRLVSNLTLDNFIDVIESIRKQLELNTMALFAHSALGVLAYEYAIKYQDKVTCLIMVATAPIWTDYKKLTSQRFFQENASEQRKILYRQDQVKFQRMTFDNEREKFVEDYCARRAVFFRSLPSHGGQQDAAKKLWQSINHYMSLVRKYRELIQNYDIRLRPKVDIKTFQALGLYDYSVPFYSWTDDTASMTDNVPYFPSYYIFSDSGHYPPMEEPDAFVEEVRTFLNTQVYSDLPDFTV